MTEEQKEKKVCPRCFGREVIELPQTHYGIPITEPCLCAIARDTYKNLERGWRGITTAPRIPESPLVDRVTQDLWIRANDTTLKTHLKHIGIRMGRNWSFLVTSDAGLITAWLASAVLKGEKIFDQDVSEAASVSLEKLTLLDLVEPPGLLIIRLGVKFAKNIAMADVLLEALALRDHENKPTWVVDQPGHRLDAGTEPLHRCYSPEVVKHLQQWDFVSLDDQPDSNGLKIEMMATSLLPREEVPSLSSSQGNSSSGARRVPRPDEQAEPPKSRRRS